MEISFVATVFNEESTIGRFVKSLLSQSRMPDEIVIADGGSTDATVEVIKNYKSRIKKTGVRFKLLIKKGNRAVGRNEAIKNASNEIIVCSDAGCILDKDWIKNITEPFKKQNTDVVAGYYRGLSKTTFEKCLIPYVLVMPDKINADNFLPATRSMAFRKFVWENAGRFNERYSHNEDYVFAKRLKKINASIVFVKNAIVYWLPRTNIKDAFTMFYRFAKGDAESRILRPKVKFIFLRYFLFVTLTLFFLILKSYILLNILYFMVTIYILWSIAKNFKYVNDWRAFLFLPLIQITSDIAVMVGTIKGIL